MPTPIRSLALSSLIAVMWMGLTGCSAKNKQDPLEPLNRRLFAANKKLDKFVVKPIATGYDKILPAPIKTSVAHFFNNIWTLPTIANDLLQFEFQQAGVASMRFVFNTTLGIGGLFDVASKSPKLPPHKQDFGHTLERWGYKQSAYLVLPLFGPSTVRDGVGRVVTLYMTPYPYLRSVALRNSLVGLNFISERAELLKLDTVIETAAVDQYVFIRDAYLQKREGDVSRGSFTIGKESGISETSSGGEGGSSLEALQGPPE